MQPSRHTPQSSVSPTPSLTRTQSLGTEEYRQPRLWIVVHRYGPRIQALPQDQSLVHICIAQGRATTPPVGRSQRDWGFIGISIHPTAGPTPDAPLLEVKHHGHTMDALGCAARPLPPAVSPRGRCGAWRARFSSSRGPASWLPAAWRRGHYWALSSTLAGCPRSPARRSLAAVVMASGAWFRVVAGMGSGASPAWIWIRYAGDRATSSSSPGTIPAISRSAQHTPPPAPSYPGALRRMPRCR